MKKMSVLTLAVALTAAGGAFAATSHEDAPGSRSASTSLHQLGADVRGALHKLGDATRHALHRADAAVHRDRRDARDRNA